MREKGLIFSRSGYALRTYCVSPYLYPQFGQYNKYFLPKHRDLPTYGMVTRMYVFDFGYSNPGNQIAPYQLAQCPLVLGRDFVCWAVTQVSQSIGPQILTNPATGTANVAPSVSPAYLVNFLHTHQDSQRQWSNKAITEGEAAGTGRYPLMLKDPALLPQGDTITCVIQNTSNCTLAAQVCFLGAEFDTETFGQEAGV